MWKLWWILCNVGSSFKVSTFSLGCGVFCLFMLSSSLASAAVTVHSFPSQSVQAPMVSTTVAGGSLLPPGQPSPSGVVENAYVRPLLTLGDTVNENLQGDMNFIREQREAATHLAASLFADLENVCNNLRVVTVTVSKRNSAAERL